MKFLPSLAILCTFCFLALEAKPRDDISSKFTGINPANLVTIDKDTYYVSSDFESLNVANAETFCKDQGMQLVSFTKESEWTAVSEYLQTHNGFEGKAYWTSGQKVGNSWMWTSINKEFTFTAWDVALGEPDETADEICVYLYPGSGWYDMDCNLPHNFICEY